MDGVALTALVRNHAGWVETRQAQVARNIANIDTPGAKTLQIESFSKVLEQSRAGQMPGMALTHSRHISSSSSQNGVATKALNQTPVLEREMIALTETRRSHDLNIAIVGAFHRMQIAAVKS